MNETRRGAAPPTASAGGRGAPNEASDASGRADRGDPSMDDAELRERTKKTAARLFHTVKGGAGYDLWKRFDPGLARQLSMFFAGTLYSREVIPQRERELCAVASLTVLNRTHELRAHIHAALNVGATRREVGEVIMQQVTYGGMPVVVDGLRVYAQVLEERGEPFPAEGEA
jgi:4-carboxymuconolactone decarboxylase